MMKNKFLPALSLVLLSLLAFMPAAAYTPQCASTGHGRQQCQGTLDTLSVPSGVVVMGSWVAPVASTVAISGTRAANSATNALPTVVNTDVCRSVKATFGVGWDGGNINVIGTDCSGFAAASTIIAAPGSSAESLNPFKIVASAAKTTVGASAATVQLFNGSYLGMATGHRVIVGAPSSMIMSCLVFVNNVGETPSNVVSVTGADPEIGPTSAPNGLRNFKAICPLL